MRQSLSSRPCHPSRVGSSGMTPRDGSMPNPTTPLDTVPAATVQGDAAARGQPRDAPDTRRRADGLGDVDGPRRSGRDIGRDVELPDTKRAGGADQVIQVPPGWIEVGTDDVQCGVVTGLLAQPVTRTDKCLRTSPETSSTIRARLLQQTSCGTSGRSTAAPRPSAPAG